MIKTLKKRFSDIIEEINIISKESTRLIRKLTKIKSQIHKYKKSKKRNKKLYFGKFLYTYIMCLE